MFRIRARVGCGVAFLVVSFRASFAPASSGLARGQPWFYLRLATWRGTIALLGCPREHTVPRETFRLNPAVDTYPRTRALRDRRNFATHETMVSHPDDAARSSCL